MKKLICFDLDGTLIDTLPDLAAAVNYALEQEKLPAKTIAQIKSYIGDGVITLLSRSSGHIGSDGMQKRLKQHFDDYYNIHYHDYSTAYDGMENLLLKLQESGRSVLVYSNKSVEFIAPIMKIFYPTAKFERLLGNNGKFLKKPNAVQLKLAQKELGFADEECVYIGDSDVDYATAQNANMDFIGVDWGYRSREELEKVGAKIICGNAEEVLSAINSIF